MKNVYMKKENCCGCTACYSICPKHAISMKPDQEGFLYPIINASECVGCDLCKKVCPIQKNIPLKSFERHGYVIRALDQSVVSRSTSGGFVSPLADWIDKRGGVVCGATYDENYKVVHVVSGGGQAFRGSKYVQSDLKDCFTEIKKYIENKTVVCFIGTPCQVYGLKSFLGKEYDNLVTIDVVCHGTPSPKMWEKYLNLQKSKYHSEIESVAFRYKTYGYHSSTMRITFKNGKSYFGSARVDLMLKSFFEGLSSRPSCYNCHFKTLERCSDFTIYDCWNAEKLVNNLIDDDKGFTNLIVQSSKGEKILEEIKDKYELYSVDLKKAADLDGVMIWNSAQPHPRRNEFYHGIDDELLDKYVQKFAPIKVKDYLIEYSKKYLYNMGAFRYIRNKLR